jgi:hypothetical protein
VTWVEREAELFWKIMDEELLEKLGCFEAKYGVRRIRRLGSGIHGIVFLMRSERGDWRAVKILGLCAAFERECEVYGRLRGLGVTEIRGHQVPILLRVDDALLAIEMSVVERPFVLDFASAYLDFPPKFAEGAMEHLDEEMRENFGFHYEDARRILEELEEHGIYQTDPSPRNIGFPEEE